MVDVLLPGVAFAKKLILRIGWDSYDKIGHLKCAMLFISGDKDELVRGGDELLGARSLYHECLCNSECFM